MGGCGHRLLRRVRGCGGRSRTGNSARPARGGAARRPRRGPPAVGRSRLPRSGRGAARAAARQCETYTLHRENVRRGRAVAVVEHQHALTLLPAP